MRNQPYNIIPTFASNGFQIAKYIESYIVETSNFKLGSDDTYFVTYWKPKGMRNPKGLVFICHGFADYFGQCYDGIAEALVQRGYLVFGHDHIGHGRSSGVHKC